MALTHRRQILGIFIRDVTTPLLSRNTGNSSSTLSLPAYFSDNQQLPSPIQNDPHLTHLKRPREFLRGKSQDNLSLAAFPSSPSSDDESLSTKDFEKMALSEMEPLAPLYFKALETDDSPIPQDLPLRQSKTPPPIPTRPTLSSRVPSSSSINSEPARTETIRGTSPTPSQFSLEQPSTTIEEPTPSSRIKRVEQWKKRLATAREKLIMHDCGVEIWTWRIGQDVENICETLVLKEIKRGREHLNGSHERNTPDTSVLV
jgi:hypothetical protein